MYKQLEKNIEEKIIELDMLAETPYENEDWDEVVAIYQQMYELLPAPKEEYEWTHLIYGVISSMYYKKGSFEQAKIYAQKELSLHVYTGKRKKEMDAPANWQMGKILYEEGDEQGALEYFKVAWGLVEIENEDPKYENFIKVHLDVEDNY